MTDADLNLDQRRIAYVAKFMDGIGDIDFHETAVRMAEVFGHAEPTEVDYYRAVCIGIDTLRNEATAKRR
jgi:hypothetical protein